ncbi:MAG: hypothetical protein ACYDEC_10700 [Bacteroidia bacterium]
MKFPVIYFKFNSTEYADMPYTADSCLKYYIKHTYRYGSTGSSFDIRIYRDEDETEQLTARRITKLKHDINQIKEGFKISIKSWGAWQKEVNSNQNEHYSPLGIMVEADRVYFQSVQ